MKEWKEELEAEFVMAEAARRRGNEGRARVCARRAAGIAIREHFTRRGRPVRTASAYDLLQLLGRDPDLAPGLKPIIEHLTVRVTEEFQLPVQADLVAEARRLCRTLLPDWED
jgi:hypothetical protein